MLVAAVQAQADLLYCRSPRFRHCFAMCGSAYRCMSHRHLTVCSASAATGTRLLGPLWQQKSSVPACLLQNLHLQKAPRASLLRRSLSQHCASKGIAGTLNPPCFAATRTMAGASSLQHTSLSLLVYGHRRRVLGASKPVYSYSPHICI
jgi:hypothetical protein